MSYKDASNFLDARLGNSLVLKYRGGKATSWKAWLRGTDAFVLSCPEDSMRLSLVVGGIALLVVAGIVLPCLLDAGEINPTSGYSLLDPIRSGNLTVFPVVANKSFDTGQFLTLDEGIRSGEVVVTEAGQAQGLIRRRPGTHWMPYQVRDAEVSQLVLANNSKRPLLLLAGEIVTGGKQDRVIGKDRIVPAESDPVDLSVFCVEPGRWVATSEHFGSSGAMYGGAGIGSGTVPAPTMMAQPSVRAKAMADKNQGEVWAEVRKQKEAVVGGALSGISTEAAHTSSYARLMENEDVKKQVDAVAKPIEQNYQSLI